MEFYFCQFLCHICGWPIHTQIFGNLYGTWFLTISMSYLWLSDFQQIKVWAILASLFFKLILKYGQNSPILPNSSFLLFPVFSRWSIWWRPHRQWSFDLRSLIFFLCSLYKGETISIFHTPLHFVQRTWDDIWK